MERDSALPEGSRASSELRVDGGEGGATSVAITEEEYDIEHHKQITAKRNFDKVIFGRWQIKTWYVLCSSSTSSLICLTCDDAGNHLGISPHTL